MKQSKITADTMVTENESPLSVNHYLSLLSDENILSSQSSHDKDGFFQMLIESIEGYAVITIDNNGVINSWNRGAQKLLLYSDHEVIGKPTSIFFTDTDITNKLPSKELAKAKKDGKAVHEGWRIKKDGTRFWASGFILSLKDEKGKLLGFTKIIRDLTDQKLVETEREKYSAIFQNAPAFIALLQGKEHVFELVNKPYLQLVGSRDIVGKSVVEALPEMEEQGFVKILNMVYETGKPYIGKEVALTLQRRKDSQPHTHYINFVYQPIKNANHEISGIFVHGFDVTEQVLARKKIEESQRNSAFLSEASKVLSSSLNYKDILTVVSKLSIPYLADFCVFDMLTDDNTIQRVTWAHADKSLKEYIKIVESFTPDTSYTKNPVAYSLQVGKPVFAPLVDDAWLQKTATSPKHLAFQRKLGYTSVMTVPLRIRGEVRGNLAFIYTKFSNRQYTETELRLAEELAYRAAIAIENSRLYQQSQKEIEARKALEKQKDDFIGMASHELKTPVTSLKGFTQVLQVMAERNEQPGYVDLLKKMDAQLNKLTDLIGDLLDVTKIESGRLHFNLTKFDFDQLVDDVVESLQLTTEKHVLIKQGKTGKTVYGDRDRIEQVMNNLISNAIKYSPHTEKIMVMSAVEDGLIQFCVQDFGIGIPKDKQEKVFEQFFRVSGPNTHTFPGLGLGLYISSEIIKRLGGRIWVNSNKGKGSTFCFSLPIRKRPIEQQEHTMSDEEVSHL